ncbi:zinc ribbon domain-containing protein [candidate division FCPU426 bacterium]|nr:zinc ribbon domain-containing protein [candidate division FCPU426 bacterium]
MPTYDYQCRQCGNRFEQRQSMKEAPLTQCPQCGGEVRRLISGGTGYIMKGPGGGRSQAIGAGCSLETSGRTCCGREEHCGQPPCGEEA